jgi:sec-independent protein translocase protein TatA
MQSLVLLFIFDSPTQWLLVVGVIVLLFGAGRLPQLAKSLGQSRKAFKEGMREAEEDEAESRSKITSGSGTPQIAQMSDEELLAEMQRRTQMKQVN